MLAVETIPALAEAEAVLELLGEFPGAQAWLSFTCKVGGWLVGVVCGWVGVAYDGWVWSPV